MCSNCSDVEPWDLCGPAPRAITDSIEVAAAAEAGTLQSGFASFTPWRFVVDNMVTKVGPAQSGLSPTTELEFLTRKKIHGCRAHAEPMRKLFGNNIFKNCSRLAIIVFSGWFSDCFGLQSSSRWK